MMTRTVTIFFLYSLILIFSVERICGQEKQKPGTDCIPSAEITITNGEIQLSSDKYQIKKDNEGNFMVYYPENEKLSFWYKISVESDCRFAFRVSSSDSSESGKFYLYKYLLAENFCSDVKRKKMIPARSGEFYREEKSNGFTKFSGGKITKVPEINFVQPISALKGENYYLHIRHKTETESGHFLKLIVSADIVSFHAALVPMNDKEKELADKIPVMETMPVKKTTEITPTGISESSPVKTNTTPQDFSNQFDSVVSNQGDIIQSQNQFFYRDSSNYRSASSNNSSPDKFPPPNMQGMQSIHMNKSFFSGNDESPAIKTRRKIEHVTISGILLDSANNTPLQGEIKWVNELTGKEIIALANPKGEYSVELEEKVIYKLTCNVVGYKEKTIRFFRQNLNSESVQQDFFMAPLATGDNFVLKHLYFYAGTYAMRPESKPEMEKLLSFMSKNRNAKIEIQGHTNGEGKIKRKKEKDKSEKEKEEGWDFHGNEKKLSRLRADAVKKFLVKSGISEERMVAKGFGGEKMLFPNPKTKEQRDMNKRVEIYILSMDGGNSAQL